MSRPSSHWGRRSVYLLWGSILLLAASSVLWGCGRGSFVGRQYDDFTAYYNTYYIATEAFEKGRKSVERSTPDVDRNRYISVFPEPQSGSSGKSFEEAIQKSADLLREHPNSKWVDDALLLIGRSYYYQQNYVGAVQKFREVIALDSEREGEARFRLVQTLIATSRYSEAAEALSVGLESGEDYGTWTDRMYLARGELLTRQQQWTDAEQALERGLEGSVPDGVGARAAFLLGQVRETLEDFDGAIAAYRRVPDYGPRYSLKFAARLNAIEMQGLHGNTTEGLQRLEELKRGDDTKEMRGQMAVVRARLYKAQRQAQKAERVLKDMLRGEEPPTGAMRGALHYELGTLYRDAYEDFTRAAAHFDTAATNLSSQRGGGSEDRRQSQALPRAPSDAEPQSQRFQGLAQRAKAVSEMDSLLRVGRMGPSEFQSFIEKVRKQRKKRQEAQAQQRRDQQFRTGGAAGQEQTSSQSQNAAVETRGSDAGFLFHRDPALVQRGRRQFRQKWGDRPLVDNWRRRAAIRAGGATASAEQEAGEVSGGEQSEEGAEAGSLVDLSAIPRDSASQAEMENRRAVAQYELGNALFRAAGRPDSAETWYKRVLKENEDHSVSRKALYALAQSYEAQGDTAAARKTYRRVIDEYPDTPFAERSREQLGRERTEPSADRTESRADSAYARAYKTWQAGNLIVAFDSLLAVAGTYPETDAAPRSLLAAGVVYHRALQRDTSRELQTRLERSLDRFAPPDSGAETSSKARPDTTAPKQEVTSPPDSASADTTTGKQEAPQDRPERDTTRVSQQPRPEQPAPPSTEADDSLTTTGDSTSAPSDSTTPPDRSPPRPDVVADSTMADSTMADSTMADSTMADSTIADSTIADSTIADSTMADSTTVPPSDTSVAVAEKVDSTAAARGAATDSSRTASGRSAPTVPLKALFTYVSKRYSETYYAKRAQSLLNRLNQQSADSTITDSAFAEASSGAGMAADSSVASRAIPADSLEASDETAADSAAGPQRPSANSTRVEGESRTQSRRQDSTVAPQPAPRSRPRADSTREGWTLLLRTFEEAAQADTLLRRVEQRLSDRWSAQVLADSTGTPLRYRITIGRFNARRKATRAKTTLPEPLSKKSEVWPLPARRTQK